MRQPQPRKPLRLSAATRQALGASLADYLNQARPVSGHQWVVGLRRSASLDPGGVRADLITPDDLDPAADLGTPHPSRGGPDTDEGDQ